MIVNTKTERRTNIKTDNVTRKLRQTEDLNIENNERRGSRGNMDVLFTEREPVLPTCLLKLLS